MIETIVDAIKGTIVFCVVTFAASWWLWLLMAIIFFAHGIIGLYHGQPTTSRFHELDHAPGYVPFLWKRGSIFCYDGHAELQRDPWPTFEVGSGYEARSRSGNKEFRMNGTGKSGFDEINAIQAYMKMLCYSQRGFDPVDRYSTPPAPWR